MNLKVALILSLALNVVGGLAYAYGINVATPALAQPSDDEEAKKEDECKQIPERWIGARRISDKRLICIRISPNCIWER